MTVLRESVGSGGIMASSTACWQQGAPALQPGQFLRGELPKAGSPAGSRASAWASAISRSSFSKARWSATSWASFCCSRVTSAARRGLA